MASFIAGIRQAHKPAHPLKSSLISSVLQLHAPNSRMS
jgi:hypothetical protein